MKLFCDNKAARDIAPNLVQYDRTKQVEVDRFFIKEKSTTKLSITGGPKTEKNVYYCRILSKIGQKMDVAADIISDRIASIRK